MFRSDGGIVGHNVSRVLSLCLCALLAGWGSLQGPFGLFIDGPAIASAEPVDVGTRPLTADPELMQSDSDEEPALGEDASPVPPSDSPTDPLGAETLADPLAAPLADDQAPENLGPEGRGPEEMQALLPTPGPPRLPWRYAELFRPEAQRLDTYGERESGQSLPNYDVPIVLNRRVELHIQSFNTSMRDRFEEWLTRLRHYKPLVDKIFTEFNLPSDLVFLSLVESGFNPRAYSRARATGPWQFMTSTARLYGLRIDHYVDERRDPVKSTVAAARYLRDLYDLFGTWPLALAAYNAGEGKVLRALQKARAESFWELAQTRLLRRETREYVPRFMAATIIAKNPEQYGFTADTPDPHQFEEVVVGRPVLLRDVEKVTGVPYQELRRLNPELRRDVTPPDETAYHLKVPVGMAATVELALDQVPTWKPPLFSGKRGDLQAMGRQGWYRVRLGDSLWTIAKRFKLTVAELRERNNLRGRMIRPGELIAIGP
ncbi:MAG: transglycosylase SLT domain-containing protein [Nitrospiraceae bacterium]